VSSPLLCFPSRWRNFADRPSVYHIHKFPVLNGNCTSAGSHLDPYNRGEVPPCDKSKKETCEVGDLSGKYRNLTGRADSDS
jgi:Cu/Zn superoxide dismutase